MTAAEQVERVARALHADACNDGACYHTPGEWVRDARVAIAAMQPEPVILETVEEFRALANYTPAMDMSKDVCMWVVDSDGERRLSSTFMGLLTPEETPEMVIDFPVTVLYPRPTPEEGQLEELKAAVRAGVEHTVNTETQEGVGHTIDHWRGMHFADGRDAGIELLAEQVYAILDKDEVPEVPEVPEGKD